MADYVRQKEGFRFRFGGIKLNSVPDSLPPDKYSYSQNVRAFSDHSTQTRPGQSARFSTGGQPITDIGSYVTLLTDGLPRYLARDGSDRIYLDTGALLFTLAGGGASPGATFLPFRPNQSPNPYLYVANGFDYQKFSAPSPTVTIHKVGLIEPQTPPDAAPIGQIQSLVPNNPSWSTAGAAGSLATGNRITDTVGAVFVDPASLGAYSTFTVGTGSTIQYQRGMLLTIGGETFPIVNDVFAPLPTPIGIAAIRYYSGSTGRCVVVPQNLAASPGNEGTSIYTQALLNVLRRGAIVQFSGGSEQCFVLDSTVGPDGTVSFETTTVATHAAGESVTMPPAVAVVGAPPTPGAAITSPDIGVVISGANAIGTVTSGTSAFNGSFFSSGGESFQPEDYIHLSLFIDSLQDVQQVQIAFDVGDGSFTQNYYYYSIRANDIQAALASVGITPTQSQLAMVQTLSQRHRIDLELANESGNQGLTNPGKQTTVGNSQWSEIKFPISALTRVGSDLTKTLQNANAVQLLFQSNAVAGFTAHFNSITLTGQSQADVGDIGEPYRYRVRPRNSLTGVKGNPSPSTRYGISPRRQQVTVTIPPAVSSQQDTWDIFRFGGSITSWRYVGSVPSTFLFGTTFNDNFSDDAVNAGEELEFDNFEPWPSIDFPLIVSGALVVGTLAVVSIPGTTNILRYLPGTLVRLGDGNVYTLWTRPTQLSSTTYLLQFVESADFMASATLYINEPILARQFLPYMWGPDASGTVFACGDPLRPGTLSFAKNYAPDAAPDSYNIEITPPTEPLMGGEILDGLSFVASTERWWALIPQPDNPLQRFNVRQEPLPFGLIAPWAHATDGTQIFSWAKDGIWSSAKGSLTDPDLYNLFPHEGIPGKTVTYNGRSVFPPDYSRAGTFRLTYANRYLYATYQDSMGLYRALTLDLRNMAWTPDVYTPAVSTLFHPDQQAGTLLTPTPPPYDEVVMGTIDGRVCAQAADTNDLGGPIVGALATFEFDGGDVRAGEQWGDIYLDSTPIAAGAALVLTPMFLGAPAAPPVTIPQSTTRQQQPVSIGGELLSNFLGAMLTWTDDFTRQSAATKLYVWQPSFIPKPETIDDRFSDWDDAGVEGAKFWQGFVAHLDTFNVVKNLAIRDADTLTLHPFTPMVQHNGESEKAYSFNTPFIAHMVRIEPQDQLPWRFWDCRWIVEPTPEVAETWITQATTHGQIGYMHLRQVSITYAATAPVILAISVYDGTAPANITLPSTGGAVQKLVFPLTYNKGQLYFYSFTSPTPFQIYRERCEVKVGGWGRDNAYQNVPLVGGENGDTAKI